MRQTVFSHQVRGEYGVPCCEGEEPHVGVSAYVRAAVIDAGVSQGGGGGSDCPPQLDSAAETVDRFDIGCGELKLLERADMKSFKPANKDHAIVEAVVGLRFAKSLNEAEHKALLGLASKLASEHRLPGRVQLEGFALMLGRLPIASGYKEVALGPGVLFQRVNEEGVAEAELTIEGSAVIYRTRNYERWSDIQKVIIDILVPLASAALKDNGVSVLELRCLDRFDGDQGVDDLDFSELLNPQGSYVPAGLRDQISSSFHIHLGWFEQQDETKRTLVNLEMDTSLPEPERAGSLRLMQVVSQQFADDGLSIPADKVGEVIAQMFDVAHRRDKQILRDVLSQDAQTAIALDGRVG